MNECEYALAVGGKKRARKALAPLSVMLPPKREL